MVSLFEIVGHRVFAKQLLKEERRRMTSRRGDESNDIGRSTTDFCKPASIPERTLTPSSAFVNRAYMHD